MGRILREYGEESNWYPLQNKIVKARSRGGLHSTGELVDLIRNSTYGSRGRLPQIFVAVLSPSLSLKFFFFLIIKVYYLCLNYYTSNTHVMIIY